MARARDEVDRIADAWHHQRPDLDVSPLHVFSRVSRLARHLEIARRRTFESHGLEAWEFDVLSALRRAGEPYELTPGRLIEETLVSSGTMTNRIDRLALKGLVARDADSRDRRVVIVRLTEKGRTVVDASFGDLLAFEEEFLEPLKSAEKDSLADKLRALLLQFSSEDTPEG